MSSSPEFPESPSKSLTRNKATPAKCDEVCKDFDQVLVKIGAPGRYQKFLLYAFLCPFAIIEPLIVTNSVFMLSEPKHWCAPPNDTISMEFWKNNWIPRELDPEDGTIMFKSCAMLNETGDEVPCTNGWAYDNTDFDSTIPTEFNWVCSKSNYVTNTFTVEAVGNAVGLFLFGQASDIYGRKPIFYLVVSLTVLSRITRLYVVDNIILFNAMQFLSGTSSPCMLSGATVIVAELCDPGYRGWIFALTWMVFVIGFSILPLIAWFCRSWFLIGWITCLPAFLVFMAYPWIPESPRWLVSSGRVKEAAQIVSKIAKVNKSEMSESKIQEMLQEIVPPKTEKKERVWSLFSRKRLALNTILITVCFSVNGIIYEGMTLNTTKMAGNQFFNFFLLSIIEFPAAYVGGKMVDSLGRRWTHAMFFATCGVALLAAGVTVTYPHPIHLVTTFLMIGKFAITLTFMVVFIQGTELFPTNLRFTGSGFASTVAGIAGITHPYIVSLGKLHKYLPYYLMALLSFFAMGAASLLPETHNRSLPETVEDANNFGKGTPFWSYKPQNRKQEPESHPMTPPTTAT